MRYWRYNDSAINSTDSFNMLYICGEWNCNPAKTPGSPMKYATERGGKIWVLEHRYYGESQIDGFEDGWTTRNM